MLLLLLLALLSAVPRTTADPVQDAKDAKDAKAREFAAICQNSEAPGFVAGVFEAGLLPQISSTDWMAWMIENADALVDGDDAVARVVRRDLGRWEDRLKDSPILELATGYEFGNNVYPPPPPPDRICFGLASGAKKLTTGDELRAAFDIPDAVIVVELLTVVKRLGGTMLASNILDPPPENDTVARAREALQDVRRALNALKRVVGLKPYDVDFYTAAPGAGSYGWHADTVHNIVLCVAGEKRFKVAGTTLGSPAVVDVVMKPGDAVWIPAGTLHQGFGGSKQSLIWSIGFKSKQLQSSELDGIRDELELEAMSRGGDFFAEPLSEEAIEELTQQLLAEYYENNPNKAREL